MIAQTGSWESEAREYQHQAEGEEAQVFLDSTGREAPRLHTEMRAAATQMQEALHGGNPESVRSARDAVRQAAAACRLNLQEGYLEAALVQMSAEPERQP